MRTFRDKNKQDQNGENITKRKNERRKKNIISKVLKSTNEEVNTERHRGSTEYRWNINRGHTGHI